MPIINFKNLFLAADNLRNNAHVDQAITAYKDITNLATQPEELVYQARAWHLAGVSAKENVIDQGSYYRDAQIYFNQAEQLFRALNDSEGIGILQRDRAIIDDYAGKHSEAGQWFQKSLETLSPLNSPAQLGISQVKFGLHFYSLKDYSLAAQHIETGIKLLEKEPTAGFYQATALYDLARVTLKLGRVDESLALAQASLSWFEADHDNREYLRRAAQLHGLLFVLYYKNGDTKSARKHGQTYRQLLKTFDPLAAKVLEKDLEVAAAESSL